MPFLQNYAYAAFILLLHSVAVSASPDMLYGTDKKYYLPSPEDTSTLSWEKTEYQTDKKTYCLIPSDPGCINMWQKERERENYERIQRYEQKKLYNPPK
ncbi:hypothetical protein [Candidatus Symbiopectobacterium sp. 'North America']|uniref:hypothetical protein n=1 Tax=Candidatus Symbiopectobacterium sp. 'North America' TaxID=2794574 RepID=UPI0018CB9002|nr:hypothetical protein [Candidatus Symbiopectobacterium sp. 'North America']